MQISTQKQKLTFLVELKNTQVNLQNIADLLKIGKQNFQKSILNRIFESLSGLDIKISVFYEYTPIDDWEELVNTENKENDNDANSQILENIKTFCGCYKELKKEINSFDSDLIWNMLEKHVVGAKTKHLQFFVFDLLKANIKNMNFMMKNIENNNYLVFLFGLLVRYKFEDCVVQKILVFLLDKAKTWKGTKILIVLQGFMYVCCFKKQYKDIVKDILHDNKDKWQKLNKKVVTMYCKMFEYDKCEIFEYQTEILYYFPFDKPCLDCIYEMYEDDYVLFKK